MKIKQYPPKKRPLSIGRRMKASQPYPPQPQRQRFGFGEWIDDGRLEYKRKYICFNCNKTFRATDRHTSLKNCPECGQTLRGVGMMFKAPRKQDKRSWKKLKEILGVKG